MDDIHLVEEVRKEFTPNQKAQVVIEQLKELVKGTKCTIVQSQFPSVGMNREKVSYYINKMGDIESLLIQSCTSIDSSLLKTLNLECLKTLSFKEQKIKSITDFNIFNELTSLNCEGSEFTNSEGFLELDNLVSIELSLTNLSDLDFLQNSNSLNELVCCESPICSFDGLKGLENLEHLNIGGTKLKSLSQISTLKNLNQLVVWSTNLENLEGIKKFTRLKRLYFPDSQIKSLTALVGHPSIQVIYGRKCQITNFSPEILSLNLPISIVSADYDEGSEEEANGIFLEDNPITFPPFEIVARGNNVIQKYFDSLHGETGKLNEAKLILVGEGAAGKTSLIKRFIDDDFDPEEDKTDGISIRSWQVKASDNESEKIKVHCWDFGGQEIMRATHQLFLSERSVYLVVLNVRKDENPEHWLKQVMAVSNKSPIMVVLNKCDQQYDDNLTRQKLKEKYPNICGFFKVSCANNIGVEELKEAIVKQVSELDMRKFVLAQNWLEVKQNLESIKQNSDYISYQKFVDICTEKGISDPVVQDILLTLLSDLGQVIHFKELEELQTQVLNPSWITEGIYTLLNSDELAKQHGVISKFEAESILKAKFTCGRYQGKSSYLMQVMEQFELCYQIPIVGPRTKPQYLIPDLLPTELAENPKLDEGIEFIYKYQGYMPPELMARFIVKSHDLQHRKNSWRFGVLLQSSEFDSQALVTVDKEDREINIKVLGGEQRNFLAVIRSYFIEIHKSYKIENIGLEEYLPLSKYENSKRSFIAYDRLIKLERRIWQGKDNDMQYDDKLDIEFSVAKLLDGIEPVEVRQSKYNQISDEMGGNIVTNNINVTASPTMNQTVSQESTQSSSQKTSISISIQIKTFGSQLKDWGQEMLDDLDDLAESPDGEQLGKLLPRARKEFERTNSAIDDIQKVENQKQADQEVSKFAKVQGFIKDCLEGTNKVGDLMKKAGEGAGKLQSLGKEYNKIANKFGFQAIPTILLGE